MPPEDTKTFLDPTPLVLDVDGTLLRTDLLYETFWAALGTRLLATLWIVLTCWSSPARLKRRLLEIAHPKVDLLPLRQAVLDLAHEAIGQGRPVHLVSGADQSLVDKLAARLGFSGPHYGSDGKENLTGSHKAAFLKKAFGEAGYDYAGDSRADLPAWRAARQIIAVAPSAAISRQIDAMGKPVNKLTNGWGFWDFVKELRPHQWIKNILLFFPLLVGHDFRPETLLAALMGVVAFSIGASSIYIVNDLLDLGSDRRHPAKRFRPIAAGKLPIRTAMMASAGLAASALILAFCIAPVVAVMTFGYMVSSLIYSLWLKKLRWIDLVTLASLFVLRVLTGAVATDVQTPGWLLAMLFAVFFTLACVKRMTALAKAAGDGHLPGRDYGPDDFPNLYISAYCAMGTAAVCYLLYAMSDGASRFYSSPTLLVVAVIPMLAWLARVILVSARGKHDYDPILFVTRDTIGLVIMAIAIGLILLAV